MDDSQGSQESSWKAGTGQSGSWRTSMTFFFFFPELICLASTILSQSFGRDFMLPQGSRHKARAWPRGQFPNALLCVGILKGWVLQRLSSHTVVGSFSPWHFSAPGQFSNAVVSPDDLEEKSQTNLILHIIQKFYKCPHRKPPRSSSATYLATQASTASCSGGKKWGSSTGSLVFGEGKKKKHCCHFSCLFILLSSFLFLNFFFLILNCHFIFLVFKCKYMVNKYSRWSYSTRLMLLSD